MMILINDRLAVNPNEVSHVARLTEKSCTIHFASGHHMTVDKSLGDVLDLIDPWE